MSEEKSTPKGAMMWECVCPKCNKKNIIKLPQRLFPKYCMGCGEKVIYSKMED